MNCHQLEERGNEKSFSIPSFYFLHFSARGNPSKEGSGRACQGVCQRDAQVVLSAREPGPGASRPVGHGDKKHLCWRHHGTCGLYVNRYEWNDRLSYSKTFFLPAAGVGLAFLRGRARLGLGGGASDGDGRREVLLLCGTGRGRPAHFQGRSRSVHSVT